MPQKLDFSISYGPQTNPVKVRTFTGADDKPYALIDGDIFNGVEVGTDRLDQYIKLLQDVRAAVDAEGWAPYV